MWSGGLSNGSVIFDLDGTLVDSLPLSGQAWRRLLAAHGYQVDDGELRQLRGLRDADIYTHFAARVPMPDVGASMVSFNRLLFESIDAGLGTFEDAVSTARALHAQGHLLGLASSSTRERVECTLQSANIRELFAVVVCGDEVPEGKPAPDLYLAAAQELGANVAACVAIEDSQVGVQAALRAGMKVIGVQRDESDGLLEGSMLLTSKVTADQVMALLINGGGGASVSTQT